MRFVWLDRWANRAGVTVDGVSYPRARNETDEQLTDRAIDAAHAATPGERAMVFSWKAPSWNDQPSKGDRMKDSN